MADIDRMIEGKQPPDAFFDCLSTLIPADQVSAAVYIAIKAGAESQATLLWNCVKWVGNGFQKELAIETAHRLPLDLGHKAIERIIQDPETPDANKSAFFITLNQALCQPGIPGRHQSDETVVMNLQLQCLKEVVVSPEIAQGWVNTIAQAYQQSVVTHNSPQDPIPFVRKYNLFRQAAQLLPKPFKEQAVIALQRASNILVDAARTVFRTDSHVFTYWRTQKIETASPLFEMWISNLWEAGLNASAKELAKKAILSDEARIRCFEVCGLGYPF